MTTENLKDLIVELNEHLFETKLWDKGWRFSYQDTFYEQLILLNEEVIWSSENDSREWVDTANDESGDYECWESFISRILSEKIDNLIKLHNRINGTLETDS